MSRLLYPVATLLSVILSYWINVHEFVLNPDAICYLFSAEDIGQSGLQSAMHLCPQAMWPFYSSLIFGIAKFTAIPSMYAAFLLDAFFSAVSVVTFIAIIRELGGSGRVLWLAAAVILLAHDFNILRQDIIRDHGFWAFYLLSMYFLLKYSRQSSLKYALSWSISLLLAILFRVEAAIFLLVLPWVMWGAVWKRWGQRTRSFLLLNLPLLLIAGVVLGWWCMHPHQANQLGRLAEVNHQLQHGLALVMDKYQITKTAVSQNVLTHVSLRDAGIVVTLLMLSWYLVNVFGSLSWIYSFLVGYAWITRAARLSQEALIVVFGYLGVNLLVTLIFFVENHFLAKRYLVALSLTLMLWVPFALEKLVASQKPYTKMVAWVSALFVLISGVGGIGHFGHSKQYVREAGDWLSVHVPKTSTLYTNDYQLMYYSKHFGKRIFTEFKNNQDVNAIAHGKWQEYDYLALLMSRSGDDNTAVIMQEIHVAPVQIFVSDNGDHVYIYKISPREKKL